MSIRKENPSDKLNIYQINQLAFQQNKESELIDRLRESGHFIPGLSLVYEESGEIVGHILFSKIQIGDNGHHPYLSLAPMAVLPAFQNQGIGGKLIKRGLRLAKTMGFKAIVVLGHEHYYPRFGFQKASKWGLKFPVDVPEEAFMALELKEGALKGQFGKVVVYPKEFGI